MRFKHWCLNTWRLYSLHGLWWLSVIAIFLIWLFVAAQGWLGIAGWVLPAFWAAAIALIVRGAS